MNGQDINTHPSQKPSRWVINFWDWPEDLAQHYDKAMEIVLSRVKPHRDQLNPSKKKVRDNWWLYEASAKELYHKIGFGHFFKHHPRNWNPNKGIINRVLAIPRVSKYLICTFVTNNSIFSEQVVLIANSHSENLCILQSAIHDAWVRRQASSLETRLRYTPSDVFETFPWPSDSSNRELQLLGDSLNDVRRTAMANHNIGLTDLYNRMHDAADTTPAVYELRELHRQIDITVAKTYGWDDLKLNHDFYALPHLPANDRTRFTITEAARIEVLRRLSELNHQRHKEEITQGLHGNAGARTQGNRTFMS